MRIQALAILMVAAYSAVPSARAQTYDPRYPVCLQIYQGWNDYYFECAYTSLPQCNMSASGRAAQCIVNPYYAGSKARGIDGVAKAIARRSDAVTTLAERPAVLSPASNPSSHRAPGMPIIQPFRRLSAAGQAWRPWRRWPRSLDIQNSRITRAMPASMVERVLLTAARKLLIIAIPVG